MSEEIKTKVCSKCERTLPLAAFYTYNGKVYSSCKECVCAGIRSRRIPKRPKKVPGLKFCKYGNHYVAPDGFTKSTKEKDGLESRCRDCRHKAHREKHPPQPHAIAPEGMKWCNAGQHYCRLDAFAKCKTNKDGLKYFCKGCINKIGIEKNAARRAILGPIQAWNKMPPVVKPCKRCGEPFSVGARAAKKARYHSKLCKQNRVEVSCRVCGDKFEVGGYRKETANFCGRKCMTAFQGRLTHSDREGFKRCTSCKEELPLSLFYQNRRGRDGLTERCVPCFKAYWKQNPDVGRVAFHNRRARERQAKGRANKQQLKGRWSVFGSLCWLCGAKATTTDHVIPLNRGGAGWPSNLRPACRSCNSSKQDRTESEFRASIGFAKLPAFRIPLPV
jgi:5-methylcytosine-specific restriction endonuclease McrA